MLLKSLDKLSELCVWPGDLEWTYLPQYIIFSTGIN